MSNYFIQNNQLKEQLKPLLSEIVHVYGNCDFISMGKRHQTRIYCDVLASEHVDKKQLLELILIDEYACGILEGYIRPEEAQQDLFERLGDVLDNTLDLWVNEVFVEQYGHATYEPDGFKDWQTEKANQARELNNLIAVR